MQKVFFLLLSVLFLLPSCSDDKDETSSSDEFKTVKFVVTRESNDFSPFFLTTTLTIDNDKKNYQINNSDFDMVLEDEINLLLIKKHEPVTSKYEVEVKLRDVKIQLIELPILEDDDINWGEVDISLTSKVEIYVDGKLKRTQNFVFDKNAVNANIVQYSEK